jgi:hypothetical protein
MLSVMLTVILNTGISGCVRWTCYYGFKMEEGEMDGAYGMHLISEK